MRVDHLEIKRCCCCLPLRYGLLVIGYLKLILSSLLLGPVICEVIAFLAYVKKYSERVTSANYILSIGALGLIILCLLANIALTIVYLVGGHKKCPKLLRVYNYYAIGQTSLSALGYILYFAIQMSSLFSRLGIVYSSFVLKSTFSLGFIDICFQIYIILMVKSEIAKLETNCNFRFGNIANEAECTMVDGENETNGTYVQNNEKVDQCESTECLYENEGTAQAQKKNGNYYRLDK